MCVCIYVFIRRAAQLAGILVPQPGTEPGPPAVEAWSPSHWTAGEFPNYYYFLIRQRQQLYMLAGIGLPKASRGIIQA